MANVIIKLDHTSETQRSFEGEKINKIVSSISPLSFIKLLKVADNRINPRAATVNSITKAIDETLTNSPELFWYKTKGLFIATQSLSYKERNRVELSFDEPTYEGIMDGGHNAFAIARFIARNLFDNVSFKTWEGCKDFWRDNYDEIFARFEEVKDTPVFKFSIPVEIIFPSREEGALDQYYDVINEICTARNNNIQLPAASKSSHEGCYDYLFSKLGDKGYDIEWKEGEGGKIDLRDITAMACIPLYFLQKKNLLPEGLNKYNRISAYSQKGQCVSFFREVMCHDEISRKDQGKRILESGLIKSALDMTEDIIKMFDKLYIKFPALYNSNNGSFGSITSVNVKGKKKGLQPYDPFNRSKTLFGTTTQMCDWTYPDGFIYPLVSGLIQLMQYDESTNTIGWKVNPLGDNFNLEALPLSLYVKSIKEMGYDPQKVGKKDLFYDLADMAFDAYLRSLLVS